MKLLDVAAVIYVASNPVGVLFTGQFIDGDDLEKAKKEIIYAINNPNEILNISECKNLPVVEIPDYAKIELIKHIDKLYPLKSKSDEEIHDDKFRDQEDLKNRVKKEADTLSENAEVYWSQYKQIKEEVFLNDLRKIRNDAGVKENQDIVLNYLKKSMSMICEFLDIKWIILFANWEEDGNLLDPMAHCGFGDEIKEIEPHFNWNKSKIDSTKLINCINKANDCNVIIEKGLRYQVSNDNILNDCTYLVPQVRGTKAEKTIILFGPFNQEFEYNREKDFLLEICNLIADDFRHDSRYVRLVKKEKQWADIADNIAHQVRNVLQPIRSGIKVFTSSSKSGNWTEDEIAYYKNNVDYHISHLSNYCKISLSGMRDLDVLSNKFKKENFLKTDISEFITKLVESYKDEALEKHINFLSEDGLFSKIEVEVVRAEFETAIRNIIDNAIKYSYQWTQIKLDIKIEKNLSNNVPYAKVLIQNTGSGIMKKDSEKIYQKGFRGENTNNQFGHGIGLYEANNIIFFHKGSIDFKSHPIHGSDRNTWETTFIIKIPLVLS